jgi:4-hydroxybenzoate polyprenyltransferase
MLSRIVRFIGVSHLFIALCGVALTLFTVKYYLINLINLPYFLFLFVGILLIYNIYISSVFGIKLIKSTTKKVKKWQVVLFTLGVIFCGVCWLLFNMNVKLILLLLFALSVLYYKPFLGKTPPRLALKQVAGLKVALIAIVWTACTTLIPMLLGEVKFGSAEYFFLGERFIFLFALAMPFDFRDYAEDVEAKIPTFPVLIGKNKSVKMSILIMALFGLVVLLNPFNSDYKLAFLLSASISIVAIYLSKNKKNGLYFHFIVDGMMLLQVALVFTYSFWK